MSLQIRVNHALGQRVIELPDRNVDKPITVGRSSSVEVQVPSVTVAPKHCVLFVHEGHWAVQDLGVGGTLVNGQAIDAGALLQIGDVIQIGQAAGSPTIEVDPAAAAAGRSGYAGTSTRKAKSPVAATGLAVPAQPSHAPPAYAAPQYGTPPSAHYGSPVPQQSAYEATHDEGYASDDISYTPSAVSTSTYRRPRKKQGNGAMIAVMIFTALAIGGVVAFALYRNKNQPEVAAKQPEVIIIRKPAATSPVVLFDGIPAKPNSVKKPGSSAVVEPRQAKMDEEDAAALTQPSRKLESQVVDPRATPSPTNSDDETPKNDMANEPAGDAMAKGGAETKPEMATPAKPEPPKPTGPDAENPDPAMIASWEGIKQLAEIPGKESFAVLRFEDFRRLNPGKYDKELDAFIDQKMDRIWWERIAQLFTKLDRLKADIDKTQLEAFDINDPKIKKEKLNSIKGMKTDLEASNKMLRETMGYADAKPPNLASSGELEGLSKTRDKGRFEGWKKATLYYIKSNQGRLQWMNE